MELLEKTTINSDICQGKPCVRNMRYPVELIIDLLSSGMTNSEILDDYPVLENEDITACLLYASRIIKIKTIHKISA